MGIFDNLFGKGKNKGKEPDSKSLQNVPKNLYQVVIHDFTWKKMDENGYYTNKGDDLIAKRFLIDKLEFESSEELIAFENEEQISEPVRETDEEWQFINGERNDDDPDEEEYEQGDGDWQMCSTFRTKEEAIKLKDELIKSFDESNDKDSWHP